MKIKYATMSSPYGKFQETARKLGMTLIAVSSPVQNGYADNNQAPEVDRDERFLQKACGLSA